MPAYKLLKNLRANLKRVEDVDKNSNNWFVHFLIGLKIKSIKHRIEEIESELRSKKLNKNGIKNI